MIFRVAFLATHIAYVLILTNHFHNASGDFCRKFSPYWLIRELSFDVAFDKNFSDIGLRRLRQSAVAKCNV